MWQERSQSLFFLTCQNGHDSTVHILLSNRADKSLCLNDGVSSLYVAEKTLQSC